MTRMIHIRRAALLGLALTLAAPLSAQERVTESGRFPVFGESAEREEFFARQAEERDQAWQDIRDARETNRHRPKEKDDTPGGFRVDPYSDSYVGVYNGYAGVYPGCVRVPRRHKGEPGGFATRGSNWKIVCGAPAYYPPVVAPLPSPPRMRPPKNRRAYSRPGFDLNFPRY